jgi:putative acetyltransferase
MACRDYDAAQLKACAPGNIAGFVARHRTRDAIVAECDGVVAGFSDLNADGYIDMLYVSPDFQSRAAWRALCWITSKRKRGGSALRGCTSAPASPHGRYSNATDSRLLNR